MKATRLFIPLLVVAFAALTSGTLAAPVESVESARASVALQKVDAFLSTELVAKQLATLGLSRELASARLAGLSAAQLEQLAAQVDLLTAGGTIEGGNPRPFFFVGYIFQHLAVLVDNIYRLLFSWGDTKSWHAPINSGPDDKAHTGLN